MEQAEREKQIADDEQAARDDEDDDNGEGGGDMGVLDEPASESPKTRKGKRK